MVVPTVDDGNGNFDHIPDNVVAIGSCGGIGDNQNWCMSKMEEEDRKPSHDSHLKKEMALLWCWMCQHPISSGKKKEMKKRKKRRNKEGRAQFVINYRTPSHESNNSTCFLPLFLEEKVVI
ncbi:hypothetical protein DEO72_LG3g1368 [Vigna unguiculata]|uniref:Uncharacterized protein n=1 Tax=Vigna unguiculata TaxID=3917 RepID=A0A4D6LE13_VIGUN|nr:hypothetical protein DEO72_LG3g1368 [Vigna unguiculata]